MHITWQSALKTTCGQAALTDHVQDVLLGSLPLGVPAGPVVAGAPAVVRQEDVLWVEQALEVRVLDAGDDPAQAAGMLGQLQVLASAVQQQGT